MRAPVAVLMVCSVASGTPLAGATESQWLHRGFWLGVVEASSPDPAPASGWYFAFPGRLVEPPFMPGPNESIMAPPHWGSYSKLILTQGGGATRWGDATYARLQGQLADYAASGWDGVCWDWEKTASDHTSGGFNALMNATKRAGLLNIVTSTAVGPYDWAAPDNDATGIDWGLVDFFVPQLYGASGDMLPEEWEAYAEYWVQGAGMPNIHGQTFAPVPLQKLLWGMPAGECDRARPFGGSGCVEFAYSRGVLPDTPVDCARAATLGLALTVGIGLGH